MLRKARAAGLAANLELMTTRADRLAELGRPCLPHLDWLIVNDYEIGALAGRETRRADGSTDAAAVARAIDEALALGAMRWAAAHFPEGAVVGGRDGSRVALGSVAVPASAIVGANGAGDAFAAGMLYGLHEQWPIAKCLELGHACAAASMRAVSTTAGVATVAECLALAKQWGFRPLATSDAPEPRGLFERNHPRVSAFPYRILFVRHGETAYNAENRLQGQLDIPLNARGRDQARSVGKALRARTGAEIERDWRRRALSSLRRSCGRARRWTSSATRWALSPAATGSTRGSRSSASAPGRA